jgi:hypothetical protein
MRSIRYFYINDTVLAEEYMKRGTSDVSVQ